VSRASAHLAERTYQGIWAVLVPWFRVPREPPALPAPHGERVDSFKPAEGFLRYLKFLFWLFLWPIDIAILAGWIAVTVALPWLGVVLALPALVLAVVPDIIAYVALHLRYDTTWYVMSDRTIRIRRGIWVIQETTITFENVQNVKVSQGPLQRHFGIANLVVETAGAAAASGKGHTVVSNRGVVEGIAHAAALRDRILSRLRTSRTAGLGDEDDQGGASLVAAHVEVLREIRDLAVRLAGAGGAG
jgi:membrane protein YdbS with pleckstrin-like domain